MFSKTGIDISHHQHTINFSELKKDSRVTFALLKTGGSDASGEALYKDNMFESYYTESKNIGIGVGAYFIVGPKFTNPEMALRDAKYFLTLLEGKEFDYPVYLDLELTRPEDKVKVTEASVVFMETVEKAGYYVGIYASDISGFKDRLDISKLKSYDKWVARYGKKPEYVDSYGMHQTTSKAKCLGISTDVDFDVAYKDYPSIIKKAHLNGYYDKSKEAENIQNGSKIDEPKESIKIVREEYEVRVNVPSLRIRRGPGTDYEYTGSYTGIGIFGITESKDGKESKKGWGKLLSGAGWISLDYVERI